MVLDSMASAAELQLDLTEERHQPAKSQSGSDPEFDLLLACCAIHKHTDRIPNILSRPLDWNRTLHLIDHHRVVPQAYDALSPFSRSIPAQPRNALRVRYQDNARKTLWFTAELVRIVGYLESAGVKTLPYKGPVLAQILYGEVTQRQFSDLDILILPADVPKANAALLRLGYKTEAKFAPHLEKAFIETGYEHSFRGQQSKTLLELQWQITPRFYSFDFDMAELFLRAGEINCGGRVMRALRPEDLLLALCVHAAKHAWVQLSWLCDIAQLAKCLQLDWNVIQEEAERLGVERIVNLNFFLAHKLLGAPLPNYTKRNWHSNRSEESAIADEILRVIKRSSHYDTESLSYFRLMMRLRERRHDQARFLWRLAVIPSVSEWSTVQLPKPLQPLYLVVRLSRLAMKLASATLLRDEKWASV